MMLRSVHCPQMAGDLFKPYVQGDSFRKPDSNGVYGRHWGNDWFWGNVYISNAK